FLPPKSVPSHCSVRGEEGSMRPLAWRTPSPQMVHCAGAGLSHVPPPGQLPLTPLSEFGSHALPSLVPPAHVGPLRHLVVIPAGQVGHAVFGAPSVAGTVPGGSVSQVSLSPTVTMPSPQLHANVNVVDPLMAFVVHPVGGGSTMLVPVMHASTAWTERTVGLMSLIEFAG